MNSGEMEQQIDGIMNISASLSGHLRKREVQFLATLPFLQVPGEILEIGSFKGKSTIILAKSALSSGTNKIFACDPLSLSCSTDPVDATGDALPGIFKKNIEDSGLSQNVEFYQMKSSQLADVWGKPLKILWIDGDHTYQGVLSDIFFYKKHLVPGAIVCLHDVLHGFDGPIRAFMEQILLSDEFADCGLCGSIGWGQFVGNGSVSKRQWEKKLSLFSKLSRILPFVIKKNNGIKINEHLRRFYRFLIPHGPISPTRWIEKRNKPWLSGPQV
ncbi:MAG: class I SAM-dependent methyltransferase [Proteobacteria bacterium]|nr:class I SAM-dependent methyltransferase [Pseudomonadota bacterium]